MCVMREEHDSDEWNTFFFALNFFHNFHFNFFLFVCWELKLWFFDWNKLIRNRFHFILFGFCFVQNLKDKKQLKQKLKDNYTVWLLSNNIFLFTFIKQFRFVECWASIPFHYNIKFYIKFNKKIKSEFNMTIRHTKHVIPETMNPS